MTNIEIPSSPVSLGGGGPFLKAAILIALFTVGGLALWTWLTLSWSYSEGEMAGVLQKFSRKGLICKTNEGETAQYVVPGVSPQIWHFSVRDDAIAAQLDKLVGHRVQLHYTEHRGVPSSCFAETDYFVDRITEEPDAHKSPPSAMQQSSAQQLTSATSAPSASLPSGDGKRAPAPTQTAMGSVESAQAKLESDVPETETSFIQIVASAQQESRSAENDMQKGGIKNKRDKQICSLMTDLAVSNWVGKVKDIGANSDGKGTLDIAIADDIEIKTWNNFISDSEYKTLIDPNSQLFETASSLKVGQTVRFSGTYFRGSDAECIREASITLDGKLRDPEFIFRFSGISR